MNISKLPRYTVKEFQDDFDSLFERVENNKETFIIVDENGREFVICPFDQELESLLLNDKNTNHG